MRLRNIPGADEIITGSPYCVQNQTELKGKWQSLFPAQQPLHIEIGMGKGRFLMDMAQAHPNINYLGIERYTSVLLRAVQKMQEDPRENLFFLCEDAANVDQIFAEAEVDRIYLNFSDPWPKDRHAKRRLTSRQFLERYDWIAKNGALLEFKTDNRALFDFSLEEAKIAPNWELTEFTYDLHQDEKMNAGNIMTEYEEKFSSIGNPINKMILVHTK